MLVILKNAPSIAAATVPEYKTLIPAFEPELIPETIRSGGRDKQLADPKLYTISRASLDLPAQGCAVDIFNSLHDQRR